MDPECFTVAELFSDEDSDEVSELVMEVEVKYDWRKVMIKCEKKLERG